MTAIGFMIKGSIASVSKSVRHEWQGYGSQGRFGETPKPAREGRVLPYGFGGGTGFAASPGLGGAPAAGAPPGISSSGALSISGAVNDSG